jgi:hypothetical protein
VALRPPLSKGLPLSVPRYGVVRRSLPAGSQGTGAQSRATKSSTCLALETLHFPQGLCGSRERTTSNLTSSQPVVENRDCIRPGQECACAWRSLYFGCRYGRGTGQQPGGCPVDNETVERKPARESSYAFIP